MPLKLVTVYLLFLGWPMAQDADEDPKLDPNRWYSGVDPSTDAWRPGEPRALKSRQVRRRGSSEPEITFDAEEVQAAMIDDFGPGASCFPEGSDMFGFRALTAAEYKKGRPVWEKKTAAADLRARTIAEKKRKGRR